MSVVDGDDVRTKHVVCRRCGAESRAGYRASRGGCPEHPASGKTTVPSKHEWVEEGST